MMCNRNSGFHYILRITCSPTDLDDSKLRKVAFQTLYYKVQIKSYIFYSILIILILNIKDTEVQDGGREGTAQSNFQNFVIIANLNENSFSLHVELNSWSGLPSGADSMLSWAPEGKAGHKSDTYIIQNF